MRVIFIGLGSNKSGPAGEPKEMLGQAVRMMECRRIVLRRWSSLYRSEAYPDPADPKFLNMVVEVETRLCPNRLMAELHQIERDLGRRRRHRNEPRSIDLDLLDFKGIVRTGLHGPELPHPRLCQRAFVLKPLLEIYPGWRHPMPKTSGFSLLKGLNAPTGVQKL